MLNTLHPSTSWSIKNLYQLLIHPLLFNTRTERAKYRSKSRKRDRWKSQAEQNYRTQLYHAILTMIHTVHGTCDAFRPHMLVFYWIVTIVIDEINVTNRNKNRLLSDHAVFFVSFSRLRSRIFLRKCSN